MDFAVLSSGTCLWGYGECEFTPTTAYGMAGHSTSGQVASDGVDPEARLFMKTLVFNPCSNDEIVVCYMDLLSGSIALLDKIHQLMPELENSLVLVGSHTHYGPGNYFGNRFSDGFAQTSNGNPAGRNLAPALVEHLAKSIIETVMQARGECQQGRVAVLRSRHWESAANRSFVAFQENHESANWNSSGMPGENPLTGLDRLQKAIDPRVTTILALDNNAEHVCAFSSAACHTTCLGPYDNFRYSADWPGIAADVFHKSAPEGATYHAAFALSAAGDASSLDSSYLPTGGGPNAGQGDALKNQRGGEIGDHVSELVRSAIPSVSEVSQPINVSLRSAWWSPTAGNRRLPVAGWPLAAGAEDGHGLRPPLTEGIRLNPRNVWHEARLRRRFPFQYPKRAILGQLQALLRMVLEVPDYHPICQLQIGAHLFLSAPCELTAVAGFRCESVMTQLDDSITSASLLTSTNSYMGYITTAQEYQSQQYEGGHNLFGFETLGHFVSGHATLRNLRKVVGTTLPSKKRTGGGDLDAIRDSSLLEEPPTELLTRVIDDHGQLECPTIEQLKCGPVFEFESLLETTRKTATGEPQDLQKGETLDRLWGVPVPKQAPQKPEGDGEEAGDYFEVTVLFLTDKEIEQEQVASLRYGNQTYQSEIVANFGDLGGIQKNVVVAIFLVPGRPVDGQAIEFIAP